MGIHDRDYYRDETRGSGWLSGIAPACKTLILINIGVYLTQVVFQEARLEEHFAAQSAQIFGKGYVWQLLTATFLHDRNNPFHLIWNMVFLWMAGREVESLYGSREFVALYVTAAVLSTLGWAVLDFLGFGRVGLPLVGASGAVMAVVTVYTLYNPRREILFFFVLPIEMWLLLVIYLGCNFVFLMQELHGAAAAGTAFASHLTGAAYGYFYKAADLRLTRFLGLGGRSVRPRLRVVKSDLYDREVDLSVASGPSKSLSPSPASRPTPKVVPSDEQFEARVDEVLAKIAREGTRDGLTDEERRLLEEASRRARDRRSDRVR